MLTQLKKIQQQWQGTDQVIDTWLDERQALLVSYCQLAGLPPFLREANTPVPDFDLKHFCQLLIDYISAGHFEIFNQKANQQLSVEENDLISKINTSTDYALAFNDQYTKSTTGDLSTQLADNLSQLGQYLEQRFALEDQLLSQRLNS